MKQRLLITLVVCILAGGTAVGQTGPRQFDPQLLSNPRANRLELELCFNLIKTERYGPIDGATRVLLPNGFAKAKLQSDKTWSSARPGMTVTQVDVVCSWWPRDKTKWRPDYHVLLADRVKELIALYPLLDRKGIVWNLVMQTGCETREEAEAMFHGVAITYSDQLDAPVSTGDYAGFIGVFDSITLMPLAREASIREIEEWNANNRIADSVVTAVLNRHPEWSNMLVVMDWTSSMYGYGGQAILWQALRSKEGGVKYFAFFNDGDDRMDKKPGKTGGIYFAESGKLEQVVATMNLVRSKGDGGDIPENDIEALIKSIKHYPDFTDVVLIADNNSWIRDFDLIDSITSPVHVIICGNHFGINSQYVNVAYRTGGSVHTIEEDIYNLAAQLQGGLVLIEGTKYALTADDLLLPMIQNNPSLADQ